MNDLESRVLINLSEVVSKSTDKGKCGEHHFDEGCIQPYLGSLEKQYSDDLLLLFPEFKENKQRMSRGGWVSLPVCATRPHPLARWLIARAKQTTPKNAISDIGRFLRNERSGWFMCVIGGLSMGWFGVILVMLIAIVWCGRDI